MGWPFVLLPRFPRTLLPFLAASLCFPLHALCGTVAGVTDLSGRPADPFELAKGKAVVLIFVRTDCPVANRYAPEIQRLSAEFAAKSQFFLVYVDKKESTDSIRKHDQVYRYKLMALRDLQYALVKQSQVHVTPEVGVFDANQRLIYHGRIDNRYKDFGHTRRVATTHELADALRAAIQNKLASPQSAPAVGCYITDVQ